MAVDFETIWTKYDEKKDEFNKDPDVVAYNETEDAIERLIRLILPGSDNIYIEGLMLHGTCKFEVNVRYMEECLDIFTLNFSDFYDEPDFSIGAVIDWVKNAKAFIDDIIIDIAEIKYKLTGLKNRVDAYELIGEDIPADLVAEMVPLTHELRTKESKKLNLDNKIKRILTRI